MERLQLVFHRLYPEWHPSSNPCVVDAEGRPAFCQRVDHPGKLDRERNRRLLLAAQSPEMLEVIGRCHLIASQERHDIHSAPQALARIEGYLKNFLDELSQREKEVTS